MTIVSSNNSEEIPGNLRKKHPQTLRKVKNPCFGKPLSNILFYSMNCYEQKDKSENLVT